MTRPIRFTSIPALLFALAGCAPTPMIAPTAQSAKTALPQSSCTRGAVDAQREFILCTDGAGTALDAMHAMNRPIDPTLDIAEVAASYGIAPQAMGGIEAATYSRIVGRIPEQASRNQRQGNTLVTINDRDFRKLALNAAGQEPKTLYIEP